MFSLGPLHNGLLSFFLPYLNLEAEGNRVTSQSNCYSLFHGSHRENKTEGDNVESSYLCIPPCDCVNWTSADCRAGVVPC